MDTPQEKTIFSKMGIEYDSFRLSEDPINTVRTYYLEKIKKEKRTACFGGLEVRMLHPRHYACGQENPYKKHL